MGNEPNFRLALYALRRKHEPDYPVLASLSWGETYKYLRDNGLLEGAPEKELAKAALEMMQRGTPYRDNPSFEQITRQGYDHGMSDGFCLNCGSVKLTSIVGSSPKPSGAGRLSAIVRCDDCGNHKTIIFPEGVYNIIRSLVIREMMEHVKKFNEGENQE